ncbi:hypothetical protein GGR42_000565 [Saonia flava]|uniref:Ankyrin repeat domain-containing protein n=1 Tax=Saonia flava TaxID=523696 RepID=A0A846QUX9_9FLAO|nr:ankyrin repeat domain-containing protein [Saonia flava]NJB70103.1 hypothetical protein [Saonia flava]
MNRNQFIKTSVGTGMVLAALPLVSFTDQEGESFDKKIVQEFVTQSHKNLDKVSAMLEEFPNLINAAHDWKRGDFETGLGAASHVGYKELAQHLLNNGAQANIFTACLFGKIEIVKPMLTAFPQTVHAIGPHGFTLLHHAEKGGDDALEVKEYLESLGAKETMIKIYG